eukprot:tig00021374_g21084.t1
MSALRGFASARSMRSSRSYAWSSSKRPEASARAIASENEAASGGGGGDVDDDVDVSTAIARLAEKFGDRVERLHLSVRFEDFMINGGAVYGRGRGRADVITDVIRGFPNLTHLRLSLAGHGMHTGDPRPPPDPPLRPSLSLSLQLQLPGLRHLELDLSGLGVPLAALRTLLGSCSASLERLFLRGTRICTDDGADREPLPDSIVRALELAIDGLELPRLQSLDLSFTGARDDVDVDLGGLRRLVARLPALRSLYTARLSFP